jgi:hypothetical protein
MRSAPKTSWLAADNDGDRGDQEQGPGQVANSALPQQEDDGTRIDAFESRLRNAEQDQRRRQKTRVSRCDARSRCYAQPVRTQDIEVCDDPRMHDWKQHPDIAHPGERLDRRRFGLPAQAARLEQPHQRALQRR